jgi:hypothetical protein
MGVQNPESYADFKAEGIFQKRYDGKKLGPQDVFLGILYFSEKTVVQDYF